MGTGASISALPETLGEADVRALAGARFDRAVFVSHCDVGDKISRPALLTLAKALPPSPPQPAGGVASSYAASPARPPPQPPDLSPPSAAELAEYEETKAAMLAALRTGGGAATLTPREPPGAPAGLLNQGATCYMNALIVALFHTAAFRRAIYRWRMPAAPTAATDADADADATRARNSIPFQLQALFARMELGQARAYATTGLTRAFQWDGTGASREQQDVQEVGGSNGSVSHKDWPP